MNNYINGPMPLGFKVPADMKPYNIAILDDEDSAEIDMYGEVVSERPRDWWTDKPIEGLFIVLSEFLNDIDKVKDKKNVTFRINSPGGEVFAGIAIYNRMKEFTGNVTTIVDGLAASAASIIMQGAKKGNRKVCNGSLTMVHGASSFMFGYYNSKDMKESIKQINAIDKSIAEIYSKETGMDVEAAKSLMTNTTWMSAQDAIEKGFADVIVDTDNDNKVTMSLNTAKNVLTVNGVPMSARGLYGLPDSIQVINEVAPGEMPEVIDNINNPEGGKTMDIKELNEKHPELVEQIRNEAIQSVQANATETQAEAINAAVQEEVERLKSIDAIADKIANKELVDKAKYGDVKMSAGDLALEALKASNSAGEAFLSNAKDDTHTSGVEKVCATPQSGSETDQVQDDIASGAALIAGAVEK